MLEEPADVVAHDVARSGISVTSEERPVSLPEALVHVHTRTVVAEERLRHEGRRHAPLSGDVLHHVLVDHDVVGHAPQRREPHVDLALATVATS